MHMVADITLASDISVFGQTGPRMGSFDAGYGSTHMARLIGQKRAREVWFLCKFYDAKEAFEMGLINAYFPREELEGRTAQWIRRIAMNSPTGEYVVLVGPNFSIVSFLRSDRFEPISESHFVLQSCVECR